MQERLDDRLSNWQDMLRRNCEQAVIVEAIAIVDSTLLADARLKRDTSDRPSIPGRPGRPDFVPPDDTSEVKPLLKKGG